MATQGQRDREGGDACGTSNSKVTLADSANNEGDRAHSQVIWFKLETVERGEITSLNLSKRTQPGASNC